MKHKSSVWISTVVTFFLAVSPAFSLDLRECLERGTANSDRVLAAKAAMDQQRTERYASVPNFLPRVSLEGRYLWLDVHSTMPDMAIKLPDGLPAEQVALFNSILGQIDLNSFTDVPDYQRELTLHAYQPLTQLPQIAMYDRMAGDASKLAKLNYEVTKEQIILHLASNFYQTLIAEKKVATLVSASGQMDRLLIDGAALKSHGFLTEADFLKLQMHKSEVAFQLTQARNEEAYLKSYLSRLLEMPAEQVVLTEPPTSPISNRDMSWCLEQSEQNRRELKMTALQERIARSGRSAAYLNLVPQVGAVAAADWADDGLDTTPDRTYSAGLVLSWNFWGMGQDVLKARSSSYALRKAEHEARASRIDLRMAVEKAWHDAQLAREAVEKNRKVLEQAKENYRIEEERYRIGQTTTTDLLSAQTQMTSAQTGYDAAGYMAVLADEYLSYSVGERPFAFLAQSAEGKTTGAE